MHWDSAKRSQTLCTCTLAIAVIQGGCATCPLPSVWQRAWWSQVLGFAHRLAGMPEGSLHADILNDNVLDAVQSPSIDNWAAGVQRQYVSLGLPSPFLSGKIQNLDVHGFQQAMLAREKAVWDGLHVSPRTAPSARAKLCTYFRWFSRPDKCSVEPYYELPLLSPNSGRSFISGWALMLCLLSRVDLASLVFPGICGGAPFAPPGLSVMSGIVSLIALIFVVFAWSMHSCLSRRMVPVLFHVAQGPEDQKSVCAVSLAIVTETQTS